MKASLVAKWHKKFTVILAACTFSLFTLHPVWADDTEIYFNSVHGSSVKPNLLFILDASLSMNWFDCANAPIKKNGVPCNDGTDNGDISRLDRMRTAMKQVLAGLSDDLNVGIMRFGGYDGGRVIYPVTDLAGPGVRDDLDAVIDNDLVATIGTPTVGALEEAWRYFNGLAVNHGTVRAITNQNVSKRYSRVSHPDTYDDGVVAGRNDELDGPDACTDDDLNSVNCQNEHITGSPVYISPVVSECQANYTILLTDGEPWVGAPANVHPAYQETIDLVESLNGSSCNTAGTDRHGKCGVEMSSYMRGTSIEPTSEDITTHAIGFNISSNWIKDVATAGGGSYFEAESSTDLIAAISSIVSRVSESGTTVVAPTVTVDQFSRLAHRKETYLALFKPQLSTNWVGNLKKYSFSGADPSLKDKDDNEVIDSATGEFIATSQSFWSALPDGADVLLGGAASKLNPATRRMVSDLNVSINTPLLGAAEPESNPNEIHADNTLVTDALFGLTNAPVGSAAVAGQVCFFDNANWEYESNLGPNFRACAFTRGLTNFGDNKGHRNSISAISVGPGVHTIIYQWLNGRGGSLCVSSDTDNNSLGNLADRAKSFEVGTGACPGLESSTPPPERDVLISWLKGIDVTDEDGDEDFTETRNHIGDPLHSSPVVVSYGVEDGETLDEDNLNSLVFFGTNEGFLHAIDTNDGTEEYAFMPSELLANLPRIFANTPLGRDEVKPYGMDGDITLRTIDVNNNGLIESDEGDKAYLYVGMRRGGRSYYALDVSEKDNPKFLWSIPGGSGDYVELGQSWSKPIVTKVKLNETPKDVLVFAGGYDPAQDDKDVRSADTQGRAIFMVDADTGDLVWSAGPSENPLVFSSKHYAFDGMDYSIPADLAIVPDQQTGFLSQMYVGDMGGQLWRFDVNNGSSIADLVDGGVVADFAEDDNVAETRRFYGTPDLSLSKGDNGKLTINIGLGSGYRAHPLNTSIDDKFFLFQYSFAGYGDNYGVPQTTTTDDTENSVVAYVPATLDELYDATENEIGQGPNQEQARLDLADAEGWRIDMEDTGEKILDRASTFEGVVRFVSYVPAEPVGPCDPSLGSSFFYAVNLADGTPFEDIEVDSDDPDIDRSKKEFRLHELPTPGISPPVTTVFVEHEGTITPTDVSGVTDFHTWDNLDLTERWFWTENPD